MKKINKKEIPVSIIIPSRNTLKYLKWAYNSIRKNIGYFHELVLIDDASTDGTWDWLVKQKQHDENLIIYRNEGPSRLGHTILYDKGVELSTNDLFIIGHSDMYYAKGFVDNLLEVYANSDREIVVSATRVEPPLHPPGPEKIVQDFGIEPAEFQEIKFNKWLDLHLSEFKNVTTNGFFAPWLCSKKIFNEIGGHDPLFAPQSREDSDIANRFYLYGVELKQSWTSVVYHMTCRGSRFKDGIGKNSKEWQFTNYKGERNFIRKWGNMVKHDMLLLPIIDPKYDIGLVIYCDDKSTISEGAFYELLRRVEPFVTEILIVDFENTYLEATNEYIKKEQEITKYIMSFRVSHTGWTNEKKKQDKMIETINKHDIVLSVNINNLTQQGIFVILSQLKDINEIGEYSSSSFYVKVSKIKNDYYKKNIKMSDFKNTPLIQY